LAILQHNKRVFWAYFSLRMRINAYLRATVQKRDLANRFCGPDFL